MTDPIHQPSHVSELSSLRMLAQECKSICARIDNKDRDLLTEYRELGERLIRVKAMLKHGEYGPWLEQHGMSDDRALRATRIALNWSKFRGPRNLEDALSQCDDIRLCSEKPPPPAVISTDADASEDADDEPEKPKAGKGTAPKPTPATPAKPPAEDESEATQPVVTDAAGVPVPAHVVPAFDAAKAITATCRQIDDVVKTAQELAKAPGGRLIRFDSVKQQLLDAKGNLWANRPTHVCPYCQAKAKACECCKGDGWVAKHIWEQAPGNSKHARP